MDGQQSSAIKYCTAGPKYHQFREGARKFQAKQLCIVLASELDWLQELLDLGEARLIPSTDSYVLFLKGPAKGIVRRLEDSQFIFAIGPAWFDPMDWPPPMDDVGYTSVAARKGIFTYKMDLFGFQYPYWREWIPTTPAHIDQFSESLAAKLKLISFSNFRFADAPFIQPLEDHSCELHPDYDGFMTADLSMVWPVEGKEKEFFLGSEGTSTYLEWERVFDVELPPTPPEFVEALEAIKRQRANKSSGNDFPAAHSMDTDWFAVDAEGCVALFDSDKCGPVPVGATDRYGFEAELRPAFASLPETEIIFCTAGWEYFGTRDGGGPIRSGSSGIILASELGWLETLIVNGEARLIPSTNHFVVLLNAATPKVIERLEASSFVLAAESAFTEPGFADPLGEPPRVIDPRDPTYWARHWLASRRGFFTYQMPIFGFCYPYCCEWIPKNAIRADQFPAAIWDLFRKVEFKKLRFSECPLIQPLEYLPCRVEHGVDGFMTADRRLIWPIEGREKEFFLGRRGESTYLQWEREFDVELPPVPPEFAKALERIKRSSQS
jgi:hypothetical protein